MDKQRLGRINELARLSKERELTKEELLERERLRKDYLAAFREATRQQLDNTYIQYPDGTKVKFGEKPSE